MEKEIQFKELLALRQKSWGRIVFHLRKKYEDWLIEKLAERGYPDFRMSYMQVFMYIGTDGSISNDMATQANVSRQAMSKIVKDLEEQGYITANPDENDRRTLSLFLTRKGKTLATEILKALDQLTQEYKEVIGAKRFESAMQVFLDILEYHEK